MTEPHLWLRVHASSPVLSLFPFRSRTARPLSQLPSHLREPLVYRWDHLFLNEVLQVSLPLHDRLGLSLELHQHLHHEAEHGLSLICSLQRSPVVLLADGVCLLFEWRGLLGGGRWVLNDVVDLVHLAD